MEAKTPMPGFHDDLYKEFVEKKYKSAVRYSEQKMREDLTPATGPDPCTHPEPPLQALDTARQEGAELPHTALTATALHCLETLSREENPFKEILGKVS
jgi:hypothetical protein